MPLARLTAAALTAVLVLGACSGGGGEPGEPTPDAAPAVADSPETRSATPSKTATPGRGEDAGPRLRVRIARDRVSPNAEELSLSVGETLAFDIASDRAGELHVHSKPEQYIEFGAGRTRVEISIRTPGTVEVEDHETGAVVAILEVR